MLTPKQRARLKALAHPLKPILQVGKDGVTDTLVATLAEAFGTRELFKVKVLDSAPIDARAAADGLAGRIEGMEVVQVIGRTLVLYRRHPEKPAIVLPR